MNKNLKEKILDLRLQGKSYKEIVEELGCSRSLVSYHCSKVSNNQETIDKLTEISRNSRKENALKLNTLSTPVKAYCKNCGNSFMKTMKYQKYCTNDCFKLNNGMDKCPLCGESKRTTSKKCFKCKKENSIKVSEATTLKELREKLSVADKHPSWKHSTIRNLCRSWNKDLITKPCSSCGYSNHVELCHIKPVSSFPDEATVGEVNHKDNIIQLCPNCHWEFDNGLLVM